MYDINWISQEYVKCVSDTSRVYMIENFLTTFDMMKNKDVPFKLFPRQKDLLHALREYKRNITTKPRQAGITTTVAGFLSCEIALATKERPETILIVGRDLKLSQNLLEKIDNFLQQFPRWFWGDEFFSIDPKSPKNKKDIFKTHNKQRLELVNGSKVYAVSSGPNAARGISSVSWLVFDEAAFIENGLDVYAQAAATTSTGGRTIMISTPHGFDPLYYGIYNNAINGRNDYHITSLKWYEDPRYNKFLKWVLRDEDTKNIISELSDETIDSEGNVLYDPKRWKTLESEGYKPTSPWYVEMCNTMNNDPQKIAQELDVSFIGSANNIIDAELLEDLKKKYLKEPLSEVRDMDLEELWIWKLPEEGHEYIISVDNSRGDADDATAIEIFDLNGSDDNGNPKIEQVLEYNGKLYGDIIGEIADNYGRLYNNAFCVVESIGGYGDATIIAMMNLKYPNMYYDDKDLKNYTNTDVNSQSSSQSKEGLPGFHSSSVRFQMLSSFANLVRTEQVIFHSKRILSEMETWVWKNGRQDHMDGFHDDTITCSAMGLFVMQYSMRRQVKAKAMDNAILTALINANSRLRLNTGSTNSSQGEKPKEKKFVPPIFISSSKKDEGYSWLTRR